MKKIKSYGITYIEPLEGSGEWYWGTDYASGDLYEAEEVFRTGHPVNRNKLLFIHYPDGEVVQLLSAEKGQYFGRPIFHNGKIILLRVDFPSAAIELLGFDPITEEFESLTSLSLSAVEDCYNLMPQSSPLMLTRHGKDDLFQILWPEQTAFHTGNTESFLFRDGGKLYFSAWREDPEYQDEILVRSIGTGEIIERIPGTLKVMPDGQRWVLTS